MAEGIFERMSLLMGKEALESLGEKKIILFGVGGVGSWCAEGLVRSGVKHLTVVDSDTVCASNVNRQLEATVKTIGRVKVEAMKERLLEINPDAEITCIQKVYTEENHEEFNLGGYDYIVDAIDSLKDKISLILRSSETDAKLFSAMGAAKKLDPTKIRVAEFWDVRGCPLAAIIRKRMRQNKTLPAKTFKCVYDEEVLSTKGEEGLGSAVHITSIFGMTLAGLIVKDVYDSVVGV
ncbi:MAG: tRNA threonylcarbamoyladenosine dehydratase [Bacteroidales bacterium]|nr:tRNA threonylcarbamoyladenosine dehydratase [Bacteroidales bacterium]